MNRRQRRAMRATALHDYVIDQAWQMKNTPAPASGQAMTTKP